MIECKYGFEFRVEKSVDNSEFGSADDPTLQINSITGEPLKHSTESFDLEFLAPGSLFLNKYKIQEKIGSGGMGVVFRCTQVFIGKEMAIKTLNKASMSDDALQRFQTEAKAAGALSHPNLVAVHDFGATDTGTPYMVMDYVPGKTLQDLISAEGQLALDFVIELFIQCAEGLAHAHEKGVLHRDIKPSNIVLLDEKNVGAGSIRILDFGIAKIASNSDHTQELTKTGVVIGSPLYMSPEQSIGKKMDARTDVYSLGCVIFECLCGTPPFQGDTIIETLMLHQTETPKSLQEASLGREFPIRLQKLVSSMMTKNFEDRTASMRIVLEELVEIKNQRIAQKGKRIGSNTIAKTEDSTSANSRFPQFELSEKSTIGIGIAVVLCAMTLSAFLANQLMQPEEKPIKPIKEIDAKVATVEEEKAAYNYRVSRAIQESNFAKVDHLVIRTCDFTPMEIDQIAREKWIRDLTLDDCRGLTAEGVEKLLANNIESLTLIKSTIDDQTLEVISRCKTLRNINISYVKGTTIDGLKKVVTLRNLISAKFGSLDMTDDLVATLLKNNPNLVEMDFSDNTLITDNTMRIIAKHRHLYGFNVARTSVTDEGLIHLRTNCYYVQVTGNLRITDAGLETLVQNCPNMRILQIAGTGVTAEGILKLSKFPLLNTLQLGNIRGLTEDDRNKIRSTFKAKNVNLFNF